jgi:ABC-type Fe3+-hydroxamate transport system substrate-binding protein
MSWRNISRLHQLTSFIGKSKPRPNVYLQFSTGIRPGYVAPYNLTNYGKILRLIGLVNVFVVKLTVTHLVSNTFTFYKA